MLRLLLLRHSKAVPFTGGDDHERALTERGRSDAARLGDFHASEKIALDAALHSGARRTQETLAIVLGKLESGLRGSGEPRLYNAGYATFLDVLRRNPDNAVAVMLVGHNPTIAEVAYRLAGNGENGSLARMAVKFPTSALAILDFAADRWNAVGEGAGRLTYIVTPSSLGGGDD